MQWMILFTLLMVGIISMTVAAGEFLKANKDKGLIAGLLVTSAIAFYAFAHLSLFILENLH